MSMLQKMALQSLKECLDEIGTVNYRLKEGINPRSPDGKATPYDRERDWETINTLMGTARRWVMALQEETK
jgi:hypothetical protein